LFSLSRRHCQTRRGPCSAYRPYNETIGKYRFDNPQKIGEIDTPLTGGSQETVTTAAQDAFYMAEALRLAAKGRGKTSPNPMVGAVVLARGRVVGRGYHHGPGQSHAEVLALKQAGPLAQGSTLYVTIEPCQHLNKRTPPCVPAVIEAGVRRVVIAMRDPNPSVNGKGISQLRRAGIVVKAGVARTEAQELNKTYVYWVTRGRPYVILKAGMTLDGKIATARGESQWITGAQARQEVHRLRQSVDAILVGIGTVMKDDPSLTARVSEYPLKLAARQPWRVVADSRLRIPASARVLSKQARTLVATTKKASLAKMRALETTGVEVAILPAVRGRLALPSLLAHLAKRGVTSVLIEGGSTLNAAALRGKLVNHVVLYMAPTLMGGQDAKAVIGDRSPARLAQAMKLRNVTVRRLGQDVVVEGDL
jgi:diaminohydroxyphosphoribosylaminopyrimidine deaminase/5-amino-6-(5-phosphoribosylamino)uracil reductase